MAVQRRILRSPGVFSARATLQRGLSKGEESRAFCFCETSEMKTLIFMFLKVYSLFSEEKHFLVFEKHFSDTCPVKGLAVQFSIQYGYTIEG